MINALQIHAKASPAAVCVCYFYFRYSDESTSTLQSILEALVKQTVERHPNCLPFFNQVYARHLREKSQPSEEELLTLLHRFTTTMTATFYVLEALDEAPRDIQYDIIQKLVSLNVKLFITSRPMEALQADLPHAQRFRILAQNSDLDLHISKEISRSPELRRVLERAGSTWRDKVVTSVKQKCDGM